VRVRPRRARRSVEQGPRLRGCDRGDVQSSRQDGVGNLPQAVRRLRARRPTWCSQFLAIAVPRPQGFERTSRPPFNTRRFTGHWGSALIPHPSSLIPQEIDPRSISLLLGGSQGPQRQHQPLVTGDQSVCCWVNARRPGAFPSWRSVRSKMNGSQFGTSSSAAGRSGRIDIYIT